MTVDQAEMTERPSHIARRGLVPGSAGLLGVQGGADLLQLTLRR